VPDLNDFVGGMKILLAPGGVISMGFSHLQRLLTEHQLDTVYDGHFSYLAFVAVGKVFAHHALTLFGVEELPNHVRSLRISGRHPENSAFQVGPPVHGLRQREIDDGLLTLERYRGFGNRQRQQLSPRQRQSSSRQCESSPHSLSGRSPIPTSVVSSRRFRTATHSRRLGSRSCRRHYFDWLARVHR
jgi:hypothetical protein